MARRTILALLATLLLTPLLSGCLLLSGERTTIDLLAGVGNVSTTFVSAEGSEERTVQVGDGPTELQVIAIIAVESGDLQIDLLQPDGAVAFAVAGRPDSQVTRSSRVRSDDSGTVRYRVSARGARHGEYQIFFQP
ncbi:hypothetical protein EKD04_001740 [Chloroflexales bacterium ZM16-3]|nr:hypothetical protein [Chloroflexales bacterium ZM16-3]